jgi:hypothetical protein
METFREITGTITVMFAFILIGVIIGLLIVETNPPCTAYQAIDGKPVCTEFKITKD